MYQCKTTTYSSIEPSTVPHSLVAFSDLLCTAQFNNCLHQWTYHRAFAPQSIPTLEERVGCETFCRHMDVTRNDWCSNACRVICPRHQDLLQVLAQAQALHPRTKRLGPLQLPLLWKQYHLQHDAMSAISVQGTLQRMCAEAESRAYRMSTHSFA